MNFSVPVAFKLQYLTSGSYKYKKNLITGPITMVTNYFDNPPSSDKKQQLKSLCKLFHSSLNFALLFHSLVHCTVYCTIHCTVHCTVHCVHCTVYYTEHFTVHCTIHYTVHPTVSCTVTRHPSGWSSWLVPWGTFASLPSLHCNE